MKSKLSVWISLIAIVFLVRPIPAWGQEEGGPGSGGDALIRELVVDLYVRGLQTRDFQLIRDACVPHALIMGVRENGELGTTSLDAWSERFDPEHPPFQSLEFEIARIDRAGSAAQVRVDFLLDGERRITDFLNLLQLEGGWRIVNIIDNG